MSEIHNPTVIGNMRLTEAPTDPDHAVRLEDLAMVADEVAASRALVITDVTPTDGGIVAFKEYANTLPANSIVTTAVSDTEAVRVHFRVQGTMYTPPAVTVDGVTVENFVSTGDDIFTGYADIVLSATTAVIVKANKSVATVTVSLATVGPATTMAVIGALPGAQTEVKRNDQVQFTAVVGNDATSVEVYDKGAATSLINHELGAQDSAGPGLRTVTGLFKVSNRSGAHTVELAAVNAMGTVGTPANTSNTVVLNQTAPAIGPVNITYVSGQTAGKAGDTIEVASTITGADSYLYETSTDISVSAESEYAAVKQVTVMAGTYNEATENYTITATKASNGAVTVRKSVVRIANIAAAATISIVGQTGRLGSSPEGKVWQVRVVSSQTLTSNPVITTNVGTLSGSWTNTDKTYNTTLTLTDAQLAAHTGDLQLDVTLTGRATLEGQYTFTRAVGGFSKRTITFAAFSQITEIGAKVTDINKVRATYSGSADQLALRNDVATAAASFSIVGDDGLYNATGDHFWLSDKDFAGSNTAGTLAVDVEEIV